MNKLNLRWVVALALSGLGLFSPQFSFGLGLGSPVTRAVLGDTLKVSIPVRLDNGEQLQEECVKADVWFGDDKIAGQNVRVTVRSAKTAVYQSGETLVELRSAILINEPTVTVSVAVGCPARMTRRFVALVDPPTVVPATIVQSAPEAQPLVSRQEIRDALSSQPIQIVQDANSKPSPLGMKASSFKLASGRTRADDPSRPIPPTKATEKASKRSNASVSPAQPARLVLDPVSIDAQLNPSLQMSAGMSEVPSSEETPELAQKRRAASAVWMAMNATPEEQARDRQRLADVEARLQALSADSAKASEALGRVESQLRSGGQERVAVYLLGAAVVGLIAFIFWREKKMQQVSMLHQTWLASQLASEMSHESVGDLAQFDETTDSLERHRLGEIQDVIAEVDHEKPDLQQVDLVLPTGPGPLTASALPNPGNERSNTNGYWREVTVDELIDLDQQVEFFMVLGQEESAIEVLENYIHTSGALTPIPFLKLLEIYRHVGLRADYERTRMNFNLRFNAHAPLWDADPEQGHDLTDYPGVLDRIQAMWSQPVKAMMVLERSLMRQDAESYTFDLPAYKELLLLYLILRDLAVHASQANNVGADQGANAIGYAVDLEVDDKPLMATLPMKTLPELAPVLSLDLELGEHGIVLNETGDSEVRHDQRP